MIVHVIVKNKMHFVSCVLCSYTDVTPFHVYCVVTRSSCVLCSYTDVTAFLFVSFGFKIVLQEELLKQQRNSIIRRLNIICKNFVSKKHFLLVNSTTVFLCHLIKDLSILSRNRSTFLFKFSIES